MNEKLQYASMLDIPVNTCTITYKPVKKRRFLKKRKSVSDDAKSALMNKINSETDFGERAEENLVNDEPVVETADAPEVVTATEKKEKSKKRFRISAVAIELAVIGALIATIAITNALYPASGLNAFFKSVFKGGETVAATDDRAYTEFSPVFAANDGKGYVLENGVATMPAAGSIYAAVDGKVEKITYNEETKKYSVRISHSDAFSSEISGLDFAYVVEGGTVYKNLPVGYAKESGSTTCFFGENGAVISDFEIVDNAVVWAA